MCNQQLFCFLKNISPKNPFTFFELIVFLKEEKWFITKFSQFITPKKPY